jgi:hypothetical protein
MGNLKGTRRAATRKRAKIVDLPANTAAQVKGGKASPVLLQACATGEHFKTATITV